ncbi:MAG: histone deacetylase [Caldilineaceae bacterium]|nr:histone deacetylase [Caldilineaceae bacterium]
MPLPLVYHPDYVTPLPAGHRFPMPKFGKVYEHLIRDGIATLDQFHIPERATSEELHLVHAPHYVNAYRHGRLDSRAMRRIGFPWSAELVVRTCTAVGGTILTAQLALAHGLACNTAGGTHHAHSDFGSGFCIFNDVAVAARVVQQLGLAKRILVVDLDVHQGDGTAAIFHDDPSVFTFSMHCGANFPFRKHPSDLDVALAVGVGDVAYQAALTTTLPTLLTRVRPDLVFYDAGVDPHREDALGKLTLSDQGLAERDHYVLERCAAAAIPVAVVIGGGYQKDVDRLARRHCIVHRAADEIYHQYLT